MFFEFRTGASVLAAVLLAVGAVAQIVQTSDPYTPQPMLVSDVCKGYQIPVARLTPDAKNRYTMNLTYDHSSGLQNITTWDLQSYSIYQPSCFRVLYNDSSTLNWTQIHDDANLNAPYDLRLTYKLRDQPDTYSFVFPILPNMTNESPEVSIVRIINHNQLYGSPIGTVGYYDDRGHFTSISREVMPFSSTGIRNVVSCALPPNTLNCTTLGGTPTAPTVCQPFAPADAVKSYYRYNCLLSDDLRYDSYQYLTVTHSFPFWLLTIAILLFIVLTNYVDEDLDALDSLRGYLWMAYPLYTLWRAACYQTYPRRPRFAIVFFTCAAIWWFNAIINYRYMYRPDREDIDLGIRLGAVAIASAVFGLLFEFVIGLLLCFYYKTNADFIREYTALTDYEEKKHSLERFEERNFQAIHLFYFFWLLVGLFFLITPIYFLYWHTTDDQAWWLLQGVIGIAWKFIVFDLLLMLLALCKVGWWVTWARGFFFDVDTHLAWLQVRKFV